MRKLVLLPVLMLGATVARADNGFFYLGAGLTHGSLTANNNGYIAYGTPDLTHDSWKAFAGARRSIGLLWKRTTSISAEAAAAIVATHTRTPRTPTAARGPPMPSVLCR